MSAHEHKMTFFDQIKYGFIDTIQLTKRNLRRIIRLPQLVFFSSIQPVMFLLLFNFVFGGAVAAGTGIDYINFLLPGIIIQTAIFGAIQTGVGLAEDMQKGAFDRFRSLPMSRFAYMAGRISSDAIRNFVVILLMIVVGVIIGFRFGAGLPEILVGLIIAGAFGVAFSWIAGIIGMITKDSETAQVAGFLWTFPLVFASSVFVPVESMPSWLQVFAEHQPITQAVNALRYLLIDVGDTTYVWKTVIWIVGIIAIAAPIAIIRYRKIT